MDILATISEADQTFHELITILSAVEAEKFNTIPFQGSWSAGQLAEHLVLSAGGFVYLLNGPSRKTEGDPEGNISNIKAMFLNFSIKMKSPPEIVPKDVEYDQIELISKLKQMHIAFVGAIQTVDLTRTCTAFELPNSGFITAAEAVIFVIVHTHRHIQQLKNIVSIYKDNY